MPECTVCKRDFPFETRTVKNEQVPLKRCKPCRDESCARVKKYNKTDKGKINMHNSNTSAKGKDRSKRFDQTAKGRAKIARGRTSEKGVARKKKVLRELRENPGKHLAFILRCSIGRLWHGRVANAPILWRNSVFKTAKEVIEHLHSTAGNVSLEVARATTEVEHCIPVTEYDHNIPGNARRCHSPANLRALSRAANCEKGRKLERALCVQVGVDHWPIEWSGVIPARAS